MLNKKAESNGESGAAPAAGDDWGIAAVPEDSVNDRQFQALFEAINTGAALYAPVDDGSDFIVRDINPAGCKMCGVRREKVLGRRAGDVFPAMGDTGLLDTFREVIVSGGCKKHPPSLFPTAEGEKWVENHVYPLPGGEIVALSEDVSVRVGAEKALKESEARYRALFSGMAAGVAVYRVVGDGEDFIFSELNPSGARISHIDRAQAIGRPVLDLFPGLLDIGLIDVFRAVHRDGEPRRHALSEYQDERIYLWVENYVYRLPSGEIVAVFEDVTERKRMEQDLRESERRLLEAQAYAHIGHWWLNADLVSAYWSDEIYRIFGLEATVPPGPETLQELVHPDDWPGVMDSLQAALTRGREHHVEYRSASRRGGALGGMPGQPGSGQGRLHLSPVRGIAGRDPAQTGRRAGERRTALPAGDH